MAEMRRIGDMNGRWAILFKIILVLNGVLLPAIMAWGSWITVGQIRDEQFRGEGVRYTPGDAEHDLASLQAKITAEQLALHQEGRMETMTMMQARDDVTQDKLEALSEKINVVLLSLAELRAEMRVDDKTRGIE
jgi:hypothetical protein